MLKRPNPLEKSPLWPKSEPKSKKQVRRSFPGSDATSALKVLFGVILFLAGLTLFFVAAQSGSNRLWFLAAGIACCVWALVLHIPIANQIATALFITGLGVVLAWSTFAGAALRDYLFAVMGGAMLVLAVNAAEKGLLWNLYQIAMGGAGLLLIILSDAIAFMGGMVFVWIGLGQLCDLLIDEWRRRHPLAPFENRLSGNTAKRRRGVAPTSIAAAIVLVVALAVFLAIDTDNEPQAQVAGVVTFPLNIRVPIAKLCLNERTVPEQRALRLVANRERLPDGAVGYDIKPTPAGSVMLTFVMKEMLWESASRYHSTAIPAGAKIVFEGRCTGANRFAWSLHRSTTVPAALFPEFGGEFAVNN